ncbi:MAG TPA: hypothetical protein VI112_17680 [Bacteroidia bacterium]
MNKRFFLALFICPLVMQAQNFRWESKIDTIHETGYKKIVVGPEVSAMSREGLPDLRIYDKDGYETPYLVFKNEKVDADRFVAYQVVAKNYDRGNSFIVVKNTLGNSIDHIVLEVNNAGADRRMGLQGSYDGSGWFSVKDEYSSVSFDGYERGEKRTTSLIRFDFPLVDYKFFRFEFDDWDHWWHDFKYPLFIVRAGYIEPSFIPGERLELPQPFVKQTDDKRKKETVLEISFAEAEFVDHLGLGILANGGKAKDFYRAASLYERVRNGDNALHPYEDRFIASTILSSLNPNEISLGGRKVKDLVLVIRNEDDRPLTITSVKALQVKHYLVAKLEAGNTYVLRYGCDELSAPVYDMKYFVTKVPADAKEARTAGRRSTFNSPVVLKPVRREHKPLKRTGIREQKQDLLNHRSFLWAAITIVIMMLVGLSARMLKEMK